MQSTLLWLIQSRDGTRNLNLRLLNASCFLAALITLLAFAINLSLQASFSLLLSTGLAVVGFSYLYISSRFFKPVYLHHLQFSYLGLLVVVFCWFLNGGILSSIPFFYPVLLMLAQVILARRDFAWYLSWMLLSLAVLFGLELAYPELVVQYDNQWTHQLDVLLTLLAVLLITAGSTYLFRYHYEQEQELLQLSTDHKSRFMATMSHEIRTPLNAMLGFNQLLLRKQTENLRPEQQLYLERTQANGQHLLNLINQLLDLALIESGKAFIDLKDIDLTQILQACQDTFLPMAQAKNLRLSLDIGDLPSHFQADPLRLRQILDNLISNAIKYTQTGQVHIEAKDHKDHLVISVRDTGSGIPPAEQTLIFQSFYRLNYSEVSGTGLGLAVTTQLCELLGYQLSLDSQVEVPSGSCFMLRLPKAKAKKTSPLNS